MRNVKIATTNGSTDTDPSPSTVFELLTDRRRRYVLHYLRTSSGTVSIDDITDQIARLEDDTTREHHERVCTSLLHVHLPKLMDAGFVQYDPDEGTIDHGDGADRASVHLDLVAAVDHQ